MNATSSDGRCAPYCLTSFFELLHSTIDSYDADFDGEPLIYGVTLPLFKPFIAACIGAAAGGAVVAVLQVTSAIAFGVSGVVLLLALSNLHSVVCYAVGFLIAVLVGFFTAWKLGFDDPAE